MQNNKQNILQNNFLNIHKPIENLDLNNANYEVAPGEYFVHLFEPSITFNKNKIYLNSACIKNLPTIDYMQILINPQEQKLVVRPCNGEEKDSFRWCTIKRKPKHINCRVFFCKIMELMNWNSNYRYKILGKLIRSNDELLFLFDLKTPETFVKTSNENGELETSNFPTYPQEWKHQFGIPLEEHKKKMRVNVFNGYTVFGISDNKDNT